MLRKPLRDHLHIEYRSVRGTYWVFEGLQTCGAKIKWKPPKAGSIGCFLGNVRASASRVGITGGPLAVCNLEVAVS